MYMHVSKLTPPEYYRRDKWHILVRSVKQYGHTLSATDVVK